jgi:hypothetical protein
MSIIDYYSIWQNFGKLGTHTRHMKIMDNFGGENA